MDTYLITNYKGKYRVFAELSQDTGDFPRNENGEIEDSYGDFFLQGRNGERITHGTIDGKDILCCFIPNIEIGEKAINAFYRAKGGRSANRTTEKIGEWLMDRNVFQFCDILDEEVVFSFYAEDLPILDKVIGIKTKGKNISPLEKYTPESDYEIPEKDMDEYEKTIAKFSPAKIKKLKKEFGETLVKDFEGALLRNSMSELQYFHKNKKWHKWIVFLRESRG